MDKNEYEEIERMIYSVASYLEKKDESPLTGRDLRKVVTTINTLRKQQDDLKIELEREKIFAKNCKEAAEFWKKKYDDYSKYIDEFLDKTLGTLKEILNKQNETREYLDILRITEKINRDIIREIMES